MCLLYWESKTHRICDWWTCGECRGEKRAQMNPPTYPLLMLKTGPHWISHVGIFVFNFLIFLKTKKKKGEILNFCFDCLSFKLQDCVFIDWTGAGWTGLFTKALFTTFESKTQQAEGYSGHWPCGYCRCTFRILSWKKYPLWQRVFKLSYVSGLINKKLQEEVKAFKQRFIYPGSFPIDINWLRFWKKQKGSGHAEEHHHI